MEKIKKIFSRLKLKHYLVIGISIIAIYAAYLFFSSSSSSKGINLIPKNTVAVAVISFGDMIDKTDIEGLLKLDLPVIKDLLAELKDKAEEEKEKEKENLMILKVIYVFLVELRMKTNY